MNNAPIFWKRFSFLLVGLNALLILIIVFNGSPMLKPPGKHPQHGPSDFILEKLRFDAPQAAAFFALRDQHRDSMHVLREEGRGLREKYFKRLTEDRQQDTFLLEKITQNQGQIERLTFRHFQSVRHLCKGEQVKLFDQNIMEVLLQMSRQHP